jgi:protein ImuB
MIACLWFPNWPVQRLRCARPDLDAASDYDRAIAICDAERTIVAASVPGLIGLPVAEAEGVHLEQHDPAADRAALEQLAHWCEQFSPIVGLDANTGDGLFLDISGIPFDPQQAARLASERGANACGFASQARLDVRAAVADTVGAAWALAHYRQPLPVAALRLSAGDITLLHELGIRHVAELDALPRDRLAARFPEVIRRLDQFSGLAAEPIVSHQASPEIVVERNLEYPLERHDMVEAVLSQVVEQIAAELSQRQQGAIRVEFVLKCQGRAVRIVVGLFQPSRSGKYLLELLLLQLTRLPGPLMEVRAAVLLAAPLEGRQRSLFDDHHDRQRQLAAFVDRVSCRSPALRAVLVPDAQPEHAFRYESLAGRKRRASKPPKLPKRPLLVEPRPIPLEAIAAGGAPAQFRWRGEQYRVTRSWGPERIQTGWWRGSSRTSAGGYIRRDYYRVETARGCYWLFRAQGKWFLHGVFD